LALTESFDVLFDVAFIGGHFVEAGVRE
jgi:hypothetical protein